MDTVTISLDKYHIFKTYEKAIIERESVCFNDKYGCGSSVYLINKSDVMEKMKDEIEERQGEVLILRGEALKKDREIRNLKNEISLKNWEIGKLIRPWWGKYIWW